MEKVVRVSEAEMEVMEMLWDQEDTIKQSQLLALFEADGKVWKRQTLNTFLSRLEDKGLIKRENRMVEPLYSREEYGGIQIKAMIDWMYRGKLSKSILIFDTPKCCEGCLLELDVDGKVDANICRGCEKDVELMIQAETEHLRTENETLKKIKGSIFARNAGWKL